MVETVKCQYTKELIKSAAWQYWKKQHMRDGVLSTVLLLVVVYLFFRGYQHWAVGFFLGISLLYFVLPWAVLFVWRRRSLAMFHEMSDPVAEWSFSDNGITTHSNLGTAELKWSTFKRLWKFPDVWLLFHPSGTYSTLPTQDLTDDAKGLIERKLKEHGASVT